MPGTRVLEPPNVVEPRPGGVHDRARFDLERLSGERVAQVGDGTALEAVELDAVDDDGAGVRRAAQVREAEPGVVGLGVGIEAGGAEAVEPERRDELRRGGGRDHPSPLRDGAGQARVRPERAADRDPPVRPAAIDGEQEVQRPHEVGCDEPAERVHLGERLADEAEVAEAEVAQPAVDQLRRRARRARCEVVALDERDPEPVPGGDLGDAGSDDPAADDEQVEPSRPQALERGCSLAHRSDDTHPAWVTSRHPGREDDDHVDEGGSRTPVSAPDPADAPSGRSRLAEAQERMRRAGDWANEHVPGAFLVNVALERERIAAAGLLAGGLAYRLFFWLLPLGLVLAAVSSFWVDADQRGAADAAREFGMGGAAVQSAMDAIAEQHHARWYFLGAGIVLVVWFSMGVVRALNVAFSVAWGMRPEKLRRPVTAAVAFTGIVILLMAATALTQFLREQLGAHGAGADVRPAGVLPRRPCSGSWRSSRTAGATGATCSPARCWSRSGRS